MKNEREPDEKIIEPVELYDPLSMYTGYPLDPEIIEALNNGEKVYMRFEDITP
jgi:hypothetical protein